MKHLQCAHSIKLKECGVFDSLTLNNAAKVSSPANANNDMPSSSVKVDSDTASSSSSQGESR